LVNVILFFIILLFSNPAHAATKTLCPSGCDYDACDVWVNYVQALGSLSGPEILEVSGVNTTVCLVTSVPTTSSNYIEIRGASSCKHLGYANSGACEISSDNSGFTIYNNSPHFRIKDLVITNTHTSGDGISSDGVAGGLWQIENNIVRKTGSPSGGNGIRLFLTESGAGEAKVSNNIIYNFATRGFNSSVRGNKRLYLYNNTAFGNGVGFHVESWYWETGTVARLRNNLSIDNSGNDFNYEYGSANITTIQNSFSSDSTGTTTSVNPTFVDESARDLRLDPTDTAAKDQGANLTADGDYPISTDIIGTSRPQGSAFDVGAFEVSTAPSGPSLFLKLKAAGTL
jgi:hypothetical protein